MHQTPPLADAVMERLGRASTATITTQLFARGLRNTFLAGLAPLDPGRARFVGEAFTLRYIPAREDLDVLPVFRDPMHPQRQAIESIRPGQVLVIDCRGVSRAASAGAILMTRLLRRGGVAVVTDGGLRDVAEIRTLRLPAFVAAPAAMTNLALHHAVDMQVPIGCAEVAVYPGDVMVGDEDGVVCIPRALAAEVAEAAVEQEELEAFIAREVDAGAPLPGTYPPSDELLARYRASR
jgi:regulator of RNase E activity RraA